jgi:hypothetical protein
MLSAAVAVGCGSDAPPPALPTANEMTAWIEAIVARGIRRPGYPADAETEAWAADELRRLGVEDVRLEPVPVARWESGACSVTVTATDGAYALECFPAPFSSPTAGVEGPLVIDDFDATGDASGLRGAVALYDNAPTALPQTFLRDRIATGVHDPEGAFERPHILPFGARQLGVMRPAESAGALAFIGIAPNAWDGGHQYYVPYDGGDWRIPGVWVSRADGERLRGGLAAGAVTARVAYQASRTPATAHNVIGVLPGRGGEWVVIGSHHDAPWASAVEDASGIALVLAQAAYWSRVPEDERPFSILFLLTGGHFAGGVGIQAFVADHRDVIDRAVVAIHLEHVARDVDVVDGAVVPAASPVTRWWFTSEIPALEERVAAMLTDHDLRRSAILRPTTLGNMPPTDGAFLYPARVPVVQLLAAPAYLFEPVDTVAMVHEPSLVPISEGVVGLIRSLDGQSAAGLRAAERPTDTTTPLPGAVSCQAGGAGACHGDADCAIIDGRDVSAVASSCAIGCAEANPAACILDCVQQRAGVTAGCASCFLAESSCVFGPCLEECALARGGDACGRCRVRERCFDALTVCGLEVAPRAP